MPSGPGVRVDAGVESGCGISPYYDPMVAKIIAWGASRDVALGRLRRALAGTALFGPANNRDFLLDVLGRSGFESGAATTVFPGGGISRRVRRRAGRSTSMAIAAVLTHLHRCDRAMAASAPPIPSLRDWSSTGALASHFAYSTGEGAVPVVVHTRGDGGYRVSVADEAMDIAVAGRDDNSAVVEVDGAPRRVLYHSVDRRCIHLANGSHSGAWTDVLGIRAPADEADAGHRLVAPMHGVLVDLAVKPGDRVSSGYRLGVLEAMKMQHELTAHGDGIVGKVHLRWARRWRRALSYWILNRRPENEALKQETDFRDESDALDRVLASLSPAGCQRPTQFKGWTLNDIVTHLHVWNQAADYALNEPDAFQRFLAKAGPAMMSGDMRAVEHEQQGGHAGSELVERWRAFLSRHGRPLRRRRSENPDPVGRPVDVGTLGHDRAADGDLGPRAGDLRRAGHRTHRHRPHRQHCRAGRKDLRIQFRQPQADTARAGAPCATDGPVR